MTNTRWHVAALAAAMLSIAVPGVHAQEPPDLPGLYLCQGLGPSGAEYRGFVQILRHGRTLILTWVFSGTLETSSLPRPAAIGMGIVSGDLLAVSYFGVGIAGLAVYRLEDESRQLRGQWTVAGGDGTMYPEVLTKLAQAATAPEGPGITYSGGNHENSGSYGVERRGRD